MIKSKVEATRIMDGLIKQLGNQYTYRHESVRREGNVWIFVSSAFNSDGVECFGGLIFELDAVTGLMCNKYWAGERVVYATVERDEVLVADVAQSKSTSLKASGKASNQSSPRLTRQQTRPRLTKR
jgi:hypothetical protein